MPIYLKKAEPRREEDMVALDVVVREILEAVRDRGIEAVREFSQRFDAWDPPSFRVSEQEIRNAGESLSESARDDIAFVQKQVRRFAQLQCHSLSEFEAETEPGVRLGQRLIPIGSVGVYVPAGRYPLISTAHMTIIPAKVAGVGRVVACSSPAPGIRAVHPAMLWAMRQAGADEIWCLGGVQAIGAMAYGMEGMASVDMIAGPGGKYVDAAKRLLFGPVGIDQLAGPSEVLVIADDSADPGLLAADLLAQAEHDPVARMMLVSTVERVGADAIAELEKQLEALPTRDVAIESWKTGGEVAVVADREEAAALADEWAPEHLQLHVRTDAQDWFLQRLRNYGSLFIGEETTVAYGDVAIGTNHVLPTLRAARFTGGLWVGKFLKTVTYQRCTPEASRRIGELAERACRLENLAAHAAAARMRVERYSHED